MSKKLTVLVTDKIDAEGLKPLKSHPDIDLRYQPGSKAADIEKELKTVGAWLVRSETKVTADWITRAPLLKLIGRAGVGVDNIDLDAATRRGVAVINAPAANTLAAAEHTLALMLSAARRIPQADASVKAGKWERGAFMGVELAGKTLGIVGLGRIGREVGRRAAAFSMNVAGFDPFVSESATREMGIIPMTLEKIFSECDFVTLHVPGGEKTKHIVNEKLLRGAKKGMFLINCARGELIDEKALIAALEAGKIFAALDVFEEEPLPADSPLRKAPNLILTPHLGASTLEAQGRVATELARAVIEFYEKGLATNALNLPGFDAETVSSLGEWLSLSEALGRILAQIMPSGLVEFICRFEGEFKPAEKRPLAVSSLKGLLSAFLGSPVTWISAPALAAERGLRVSETSDPRCGEGVRRMLTLEARTDAGVTSVSGSLLAPGQPRLLRLGDLRVDVKPAGKMVVLTNLDSPGVIGRVGTLLGKSKVNIADMRVGRRSPHGEAVMILSVDENVPPAVRAELGRVEGVTKVSWVEV